MFKYEKRLYNRAKRVMRDCEMTKTEYKIIMDFIEGDYKKDKKNYIAYLKQVYFNNCYVTLNEYNGLYDLA